MKILMLTTNSSLMDGINRHILTIASRINHNEGYEVAVCTVLPRAELATALDEEGVKTYSLNATHGHDLHIPKRFYRVMKDFKPDIVHVHVLAILERVVLATLFRKVKYVCTIHGISDKVSHVTFKMRLEKMLNSLFLVPFAVRCVVSNGVKQHLFSKDTGTKVFTIYNPIDFSCPKSSGHKLHQLIGVSPTTQIIGTACRFAAVKNPGAFTEVMCKVLQQNQNAHAVVLGDGDEALKCQLRDIVLNHNVSERFHWLGYRQDAPELVSDLNCFVMTSISEGMPTSILEAMVGKVPFAMMEGNGGLKDIAELNETEGAIGVIAHAGDIDSLINGINMLIQNEDYAKSLANKAYEVGKKYFDVNSVSMQLQQVYSSIIS